MQRGSEWRNTHQFKACGLGALWQKCHFKLTDGASTVGLWAEYWLTKKLWSTSWYLVPKFSFFWIFQRHFKWFCSQNKIRGLQNLKSKTHMRRKHSMWSKLGLLEYSEFKRCRWNEQIVVGSLFQVAFQPDLHFWFLTQGSCVFLL